MEKKTNKVNNFFTSNSRKLVKDGLKNFEGSISDGERNFIKDITPSTNTLKGKNAFLHAAKYGKMMKK